MSMVSRVGLVVLLTIVVAGSAAWSARSQPPIGSALYTVRVDPRLCPSPLCGGYWVEIANGVRTRCADGLRHPRCYVARAVDAKGNPLESIADGALARGAIDVGRDDLGELEASAVYAPAGRATGTGGYYRVTDRGIRCVRAPCFSLRATRLNGVARTALSGIDLRAAGAPAAEVARAEAALRTKNGLLARGRFVKTSDGGRVFRASRLFVRARQPRA
jgi:hypothetical protein